MYIITYSKDMDGHASGAICKLKFPDAKLIGWDYKDSIPDFEQFRGKEVIMIDITFPIQKLIELRKLTKYLLVIDHHISFKKEFDKTFEGLSFADHGIHYIYKDRTAACEIGWKYLFPDEKIPYAITLIGRYDTWRQEDGDWAKETLPFKYYMYGNCNSAETFPTWLLDEECSEKYLYEAISSGMEIMRYQDMMDESATRAYSFEREVFSGLRALVLNGTYFNSESLKTKYNPDLHDIMVGFCFTGTKWSVSLRSAKPDVDVSVIAKQRGGGGHKGAAGFEVYNFEDIFK